jgi:hypothetical protein
MKYFFLTMLVFTFATYASADMQATDSLQADLLVKKFVCSEKFEVLYASAGGKWDETMVNPSEHVAFVYDLTKEKSPAAYKLDKASETQKDQANVDELFQCSKESHAQGCHYVVKNIFGGAPDYPLTMSLVLGKSKELKCVEK